MNFKKYQNGYSRKNSSNNSNSCEPVCCTTDGLQPCFGDQKGGQALEFHRNSLAPTHLAIVHYSKDTNTSKKEVLIFLTTK